MLFSSCNGINAFTGDELILRAPILSAEQAEISSALGRVVDLADILYRYPESGEYRSSVIFVDINGDNMQEAIIFYANKAEPEEARAKILNRDSNGDWQLYGDISGGVDSVEFVEFARFFAGNQKSMVIGWKNSHTQQITLGVYSMNGFMEENLLETCETYAIKDFNRDGLAEIVLTQKQDNKYVLRLLKSVYGTITQSDKVILYEETSAVVQMLIGKLWDNQTGVYIDEKIDNAFYGTEIYLVEGDMLKPLCTGDISDAEMWSSYTSTFRESNILSADLYGDKYISVPWVEILPGVFEGAISRENLPPPLIRYMRYEKDGFEVRFNALINSSAAYMVFLPERWIDNVTLIESPENKEWSFRKYNYDTDQLTTELLRIKVYSAEDYIDPAVNEEIHFATRGIYKYYGYVPKDIDDPLAVSSEEAINMFSLL